MEKLPLSLVIVACDEEDQIERCLRSAPFASELLVVDSFSKDSTVSKAQSAGARVIQEKWRGFGPQKRFAVDQAKYDWILSLDADEALSPELADEIRREFAGLDPKTGYILPRISFHLGRWIRHGGWFPDGQKRLFHRTHSQWTDAAIHEKVESPATAWLKNPIKHWVFDDLSDQQKTNDRYSSLLAQALFEKGTRFRFHNLLFKPWVKFVENYFFKLGFMDGLPGFIIAVGSGYSVFLKWSKLWELERGKRA